MVVHRKRNSAKRAPLTTTLTRKYASNANYVKIHKHVQKVENQSQLNTPNTSLIDKDAETVLLLEWDIERFFSNSRTKKTNSDAISTSTSSPLRPEQAAPSPPTAPAVSPNRNALPADPTKKTEPIAKNKIATGAEHRRSEKESSAQPSGSKSGQEVKQPKNSFLSNFIENAKMHRRQDSDSKLSMNFVRGFRRENSDFFPLSKRHSAILGERQVAAAAGNIASHRSSAIYTKNNKSGEPILTDFVSRQYMENPSPTTTATPPSSASKKNLNANVNSTNDHANANQNLFFMGPRRQKTESVILLRNSTNKNLLFDMQQVKIKSSHTKTSDTKKKYLNIPPFNQIKPSNEEQIETVGAYS